VSHPTDATNSELSPASAQAEYEVRRADLPLSFEVNPVMVGRDRAVAVDGLLIIEER
jgi:hypothetical protein